MGHDSERLADSNEVTSTGFRRNFISRQRHTLSFKLAEDEGGASFLPEDLQIFTPRVHSTIQVQRAVWGHPTNLSKTFDVTQEVQKMVIDQGGDRLYIGTDIDLYALFRDPVRGKRKKLIVTYVARGFSGTLRIPTTDDSHLRAGLFVGFTDLPLVVDEE
mmetsp:Transcript_43533/g.136555  ORF Transcript_43533/g.136555 Transcript_43533/m.136555 type:complete len:160 (-) Transcript_43533:2124-2603(-)